VALCSVGSAACTDRARLLCCGGTQVREARENARPLYNGSRMRHFADVVLLAYLKARL
jgi:hypothetical protein